MPCPVAVRHGDRLMARRGVAVDEVHPVRWAAPSALNQHILALLDAQPAYRTSSASLDRMSFARTYRPNWAVVGAIVLGVTGIGLLLLLVRSTEAFTCAIDDDHAGVRLRLHGRVELSVLALLRQLPDARLQSVPRGLPSKVPTTASMAPVAPPSPWLTGREASPTVSPQAGPLASAPPPPTFGGASPPPNPFPYVPAGASPALSVPSPIDEATRMVDRGMRGGHQQPPVGMWVLHLEGAPPIRIGDGVLLGRNPAAGDDEGPVQLVQVADQSVSKTHALIGVDESGAWVVDRHSTNGTRVVEFAGERVAVPGAREPLTNGSVLRLGEVSIRVELQ